MHRERRVMRRLLVRPNRLLLLFLFPLLRLQFKMCRLINLYKALSRVPIDPTMACTYLRIYGTRLDFHI